MNPQATQNAPRIETELEPILISAPFGNYIQPAGATPTLGTFTPKARGGRVWRIVKTVRYSFSLDAWTNRIGLRNPGMPWLVKQAKAGRKKVTHTLVSIHGFDRADWSSLIAMAADINPLAIELNMSCPNVGEASSDDGLFDEAVASAVPVVVKLPPVRFQAMAEQALAAGVWGFHACNTLPVRGGGMSGAPLHPIALRCVQDLRQLATGTATRIIGGGGITRTHHIDAFIDAGAHYVALGTKTMDPRLLVTDGPVRELIAHAHNKIPKPKPINTQPEAEGSGI
ncbi:hypothetical protein [Mucisphaera sp.]|uniref:hypothetical protein n=1 Tax=Mucisphaera sp. TaxID=2913024 RepID=UPI003D11CFD8